MADEHLIPVQEFITHYKIELSFIDSLNESGLIEIISVKQSQYIPKEQIGELEKLIRLHDDLEINAEGIAAIAHLLNRLDTLNEEMRLLKNKLQRYEGSAGKAES
jgi:hypothetical protein